MQKKKRKRTEICAFETSTFHAKQVTSDSAKGLGRHCYMHYPVLRSSLKKQWQRTRQIDDMYGVHITQHINIPYPRTTAVRMCQWS